MLLYLGLTAISGYKSWKVHTAYAFHADELCLHLSLSHGTHSFFKETIFLSTF